MMVQKDDVLMLVGELRGDMKESQRQRELQFELLRTVSQQITELSATFAAHTVNEEGRLKEIAARISDIEVVVPEITLRLAAVEQRETFNEQRKGLHPGVVATGIGGTGIGLLGFLFGGQGYWGKVGEILKRFTH